MQVTPLTRAYRYDGIDLPIPPHLANDPQALRAYHATLYPAITTADAVDLPPIGAAHHGEQHAGDVLAAFGQVLREEIGPAARAAAHEGAGDGGLCAHAAQLSLPLASAHPAGV